MKNRKLNLIIILAVILGLAVYGAYMKFEKPRGEEEKNSSVRVVTSFYPLYFFTRQISAEFIEVKNLTPAGAEPHDYEPTPREITQIYSADLFIYNGLGLDPWAEKISETLKKRGVTVVKMSDSLKNELASSKAEAGDPHFWLDPVLAQAQADIIAAALIKIDPDHTMQYEEGKDKLKITLGSLDNKFRAKLENCRLKEIIVSHGAFGYLARRYRLKEHYIAGLTPDEEPSAGRIAELSRLAKEKNIGYIFFETLVSPKLAETIANEAGAKTLVLNPLEGLTEEEINQGKNYIKVMEENLVNLEKALECQ